jgi:hypothetical protein
MPERDEHMPGLVPERDGYIPGVPWRGTNGEHLAWLRLTRRVAGCGVNLLTSRHFVASQGVSSPLVLFDKLGSLVRAQ